MGFAEFIIGPAYGRTRWLYSSSRSVSWNRNTRPPFRPCSPYSEVENSEQAGCDHPHRSARQRSRHICYSI
jgi:hypothetical protein